MTNEELRTYVGRRVEVEFVNGEIVRGDLIEGEAQLVLSQPYAIKWFERSATLGTSSPSWRGIPDASTVQFIRVLDADETDGGKPS
jgi:hypothetical protein